MRNLDASQEELSYGDPIESVKWLNEYRFDQENPIPIYRILWKMNALVMIEDGDEDQAEDIEKSTMAMKDFIQRMKDRFWWLSCSDERDMKLLKQIRYQFSWYEDLLIVLDSIDAFNYVNDKIASAVESDVSLKTSELQKIVLAWWIIPISQIEAYARDVYSASFVLGSYPSVQRNVDSFYTFLKDVSSEKRFLEWYESIMDETINSGMVNNEQKRKLWDALWMKNSAIKTFHNKITLFKTISGISLNDDELWYLSLKADWKDNEIRRIILVNKAWDVFVTQMREDAKLEMDLEDNREIWQWKWLEWLIEKARENKRNQSEDRSKLRNFDLPEGRISYVSMIANNDPDLMRWTVLPSLYIGAKLDKLIPSLNFDTVSVNDDPLKTLKSHLEENHDSSDVFYLDFFTHGVTSWLWYTQTKEVITAKDIYSIIKQYPEKKFVISTIACFGGDLIAWFQSLFAQDLCMEENISVFTQTKSYDVNHVVYRKQKEWWKKYVPSSYHQRLLKNLEEWSSFWTSVDNADRYSIPQKYNDAESLIEGQYFSGLDQESNDDWLW